jgi:uncharacterized protein YqjF (DUF2071 family)
MENERPALQGRVFLSADWRDLAILNYEVDPGLLSTYVPRGTEPDSYQGRAFLSLVGFRFLRTRLFGVLPVPFHTHFEEVNLRFYVRRREGVADRRGVVFIREIVPKRAVAQAARLFYGERYSHHPMRSRIYRNGEEVMAEYEWLFHAQWYRLHAEASGIPCHAEEGSLQQFITEHYWGYAAQSGGGCLEYQVAHAPWRVWTATRAGFEGDGDALYGPGFGSVLRRPPDSAFLADGSPIVVSTGRRIA